MLCRRTLYLFSSSYPSKFTYLVFSLLFVIYNALNKIAPFLRVSYILCHLVHRKSAHGIKEGWMRALKDTAAWFGNSPHADGGFCSC